MAPRNELNNQWKGDAVGLNALHGWARRNLPKPKECSWCGRDGFIELACPGHHYKRDFSSFVYLCRSCHTLLDEKNLDKEMTFPKNKTCECGTLIESNRDYCVPCSKKRRLDWWKRYNLKRQDKIKEYNRKSWAENKEERKAYNRKYYQEHREEMIRKQKERDMKKKTFAGEMVSVAF